MTQPKNNDHNPKTGLSHTQDAGYSTLQFASDSERVADQERRDTLNAYRDRLGLTLRELAELISRLHGDRISYWAVRAWTSGQDSRRARLTLSWPIKLLNERQVRGRD